MEILISALNKWAAYMNGFGMGRKLGIDMPSEKKGLIPNAAITINTVEKESGIPAESFL